MKTFTYLLLSVALAIEEKCCTEGGAPPGGVPTNSPPVLSVQCGNQAIAFTRDSRVRPYSVFTAEGKCNKTSCEDCEAERLQRGRRDLNTDHSIVGGVNVKRGNVPWQVNLGGQPWMCGGTLVAMDVSYRGVGQTRTVQIRTIGVIRTTFWERIKGTPQG